MPKKKPIIEPELSSVQTMYGEFKTTYILKKYQNRKPWAPKNEKHVISFIPGTVTTISVSVGDSVVKGDKIYGFKAMKMENSVISEIDGTIKAINFNTGDHFSKGALIIEYE